MQQALIQAVAEHFSHACKTSDPKLLATLFTRTDALLQIAHTQRNHAHHTSILTITAALFAYLKETLGLSAGGTSSQVSSPIKKPKVKHSNSQESDVFDLVDENSESGAATAQADLCALAIRSLSHIAPCTNAGDSNNNNNSQDGSHACAINTVEEKLGKILENSDNTSIMIEICEGILREEDKAVRNHALVLRKTLDMLQDPLCASDAPVRKHVLRNVTQCAAALLARNHACAAEAHASVQRVFGIFSQLWYAKKLHCTTRVHILECLHTLLPLDGMKCYFIYLLLFIFCFNYFVCLGLLDFEPLSDLLLGALSDPDIRVRMVAVPSALVFFSMFEDQERVSLQLHQTY
jgi:hypothetical protein